MPTTTTNPVHFEDFSGAQFERLVFAFLLRTERHRSIEWYGQVGSDLGRDILILLDDDSPKGALLCVQCANHRKLPPAKAIRDIDKMLASPTPPSRARFVCGGAVGASAKDKIKANAGKVGMPCVVWSGSEFEEQLRRHAESLLLRFTQGVAFPDTASELAALATGAGASDEESIALLARLFDRPAFYTPFGHESSVPAFSAALDDTIRALGTGVRQTRDGKELPRIPSRHDLKSAKARQTFADIERGVAGLRARYEQLVASHDIRPCRDTCGQATCSTYMMTDLAIADMDEIRTRVLDEVRTVYPEFTVRIGWDARSV